MMERPTSHEEKRGDGLFGLLEAGLLALAVAGVCYFCYFLAAPWIWRQNMPFRPEDITKWILPATEEHDGVELYALYILAFVNCGVSLVAWALTRRLSLPSSRAVAGVAGVITVLYLFSIKFIPPTNSLADVGLASAVGQVAAIALVTLPVTWILCSALKRSDWLGWLLGALILAPACALATSAFGWRDYTYIFAPALRLLDGAAPSQIYFQYDLLPSMLAAAWMKLGLDLRDFRVLGQAAYFLAIFAVFVLSSKLFRRKELSALLLVALILGRIYASPYDATLTFQTTPIRLDLWIPLLLVVHRLGPYHWLAGLTCGLLILLIKNFGIIYSLAYIQFLIMLWGFDYFLGDTKETLLQSVASHLRRCLIPVATITVFGISTYFLLHNSEYGNFAGYYQKLGIGFIQAAKDSFYWYVPAILSTVLILLVRMRTRLAERYFNTGLLLALCAIGNSIYFFGRSHEHNILNIAIVLIFLFFFLLDLATRYLEETDTPPASGASALLQRYGARAAAVLLIAGIIVSYSVHISTKGYIQAVNVMNGRTTYTTFTIPDAFHGFTAKLNEVTGHSHKLYFVDEADFAFYYYGGYSQSGYCNPFLTWIFTKDLHRYLQKMLDSGYYLVCSPDLKYLLKGLRYDLTQVLGDTTIVSKSSK